MEMILVRSARAVFYAFLACLFGFGIALIGVGSKNWSSSTEYNIWMYHPSTPAPLLALLCGCGILCLIILGFFSASRESSPGLLTFACLLGVITVIEIVAGALAAAGSARSATSLKQKMTDSMQQYPNNDRYRQAWDKLQLDNHCCGTEDILQWRDVYPGKAPPVSCCPEQGIKGTNKTTDHKSSQGFCQPKNQIFRKGCYGFLSVLLKTSLEEVAYVTIFFAFFQIFAMGLAFYLAFAIKRERELKQAVVEVLKEGSESALSRKTTGEPTVVVATIT